MSLGERWIVGMQDDVPALELELGCELAIWISLHELRNIWFGRICENPETAYNSWLARYFNIGSYCLTSPRCFWIFGFESLPARNSYCCVLESTIPVMCIERKNAFTYRKQAIVSLLTSGFEYSYKQLTSNVLFWFDTQVHHADSVTVSGILRVGHGSWESDGNHQMIHHSHAPTATCRQSRLWDGMFTADAPFFFIKGLLMALFILTALLSGRYPQPFSV